MILEFSNAYTYSSGVIALWATWCVLSGKVRDGVLGKIIYAVIALSGYAVLARNEQFVLSPSAAGVTLQISDFPGPGRCPPHLHGHLVGSREGLALPGAELRTLPAV